MKQVKLYPCYRGGSITEESRVNELIKEIEACGGQIIDVQSHQTVDEYDKFPTVVIICETEN